MPKVKVKKSSKGRGSHLLKIRYSMKPIKDMTVGELFGTKPLPAAWMMKALWKVINKNKLRVA